MDEGITLHVEKMEKSQNIIGNGNTGQKFIQINNNVDKIDIENDLKTINRRLEDLNSELSKHKDSLDELVKKTLTLEAELKEGDPAKEKIKGYLKELSLISFQITGTANSLLQVLGLK